MRPRAFQPEAPRLQREACGSFLGGLSQSEALAPLVAFPCFPNRSAVVAEISIHGPPVAALRQPGATIPQPLRG